MTPKEKANKLRYQFESAMQNADIRGYYNQTIKECAFILVDEIINSRNYDKNFDDTLLSKGSNYYTPNPMYLTYWLQVKQEIEKL
jgi:hypothetical protein